MKTLSLIALILTIVGGLNWGLVGLFDFDLVKALLGTGSDVTSLPSGLSKIVYILVGLSAIYSLTLLKPINDYLGRPRVATAPIV